MSLNKRISKSTNHKNIQKKRPRHLKLTKAQSLIKDNKLKKIYKKELGVDIYQFEDYFIFKEEDIKTAVYNIHIISGHGRRDKIVNYLKINNIHVKGISTIYKDYISHCNHCANIYLTGSESDSSLNRNSKEIGKCNEESLNENEIEIENENENGNGNHEESQEYEDSDQSSNEDYGYDNIEVQVDANEMEKIKESQFNYIYFNNNIGNNNDKNNNNSNNGSDDRLAILKKMKDKIKENNIILQKLLNLTK